MNQRLKTLAEFVNSPIVIDVGCDHGQLPGYLLENNKIDLAILVDINLKPLLSGYSHIKHLGHLKKAKFILGDGLNTLITQQQVDIVIAGMGGLEIINIINNLNQPFESLILQPNNHVIELRQALSNLNYAIEYENIIEDKQKTYHYLVVSKHKNDYTLEEIYIGRCDDEKYINHLYTRYTELIKIANTTKLDDKKQQEYNFLKQRLL